MDEGYILAKHDLSPLPAYHFYMQVPKEWKTLDVRLQKEPAKDALSDVAIFREPGDWMTDESAPIKGEIAVNVMNVAGDKQTPAVWLQSVLKKNLKGDFSVLNKRVTPSANGETPDILIVYHNKNEELISRMMAFRSGDNMFIVTCSDTKEGYAKNAEAFNVAISTFKLAKK